LDGKIGGWVYMDLKACWFGLDGKRAGVIWMGRKLVLLGCEEIRFICLGWEEVWFSLDGKKAGLI